jgi:hypothetical protein
MYNVNSIFNHLSPDKQSLLADLSLGVCKNTIHVLIVLSTTWNEVVCSKTDHVNSQEVVALKE